MAETFVKKKGATLPSMIVTLDWQGGAADLTGCSGVVKMKHQFGDVFEKAVVILNQTTFLRKLEVQWETVDDATLVVDERYYLEYHIVFPSGKLAIFPTEGDVTYDKLEVQQSLA